MLNFTTKSSFWVNLPYFAAMFFSQCLWIIIKFGMAITEITEACQGLTGGFILPQSYMRLNQGVWDLETDCFYCSVRLYVFSSSFLWFSSLQTLKGNVFVLRRSKINHSKSFPSISHSVRESKLLWSSLLSTAWNLFIYLFFFLIRFSNLPLFR